MRFLFLLLIASLLCHVGGNVIGLDFGSDTMKVALVQPGAPLEIVTNFQSKRKTPTCITFYRGERLFGSDAYALMARKPELTFAKAYRMLGKAATHPLVAEVSKQYFPYEVDRMKHVLNKYLDFQANQYCTDAHTSHEIL